MKSISEDVVRFLLVALLPSVASAGELADRFVEEARQAYATPAYADYRKSVLNEPAYRDAAKRVPRADLGGGTVRWIDAEGTCNFRDLGGWTCLRTGLVYRGAEPNCHTNAETLARLRDRCHDLYLTEKGAMTLAQDLGIRTDLDLRCSAESPTPDETPIPGAKLVRIACSKYTNFVQETSIAARLLRVFADEANYPVIFHCVKGADRTGSLAFVLEALLGVSAEDRLLDWELTAFSNPNPKFAHADRYDKLVEGLAKFPGATDVEKAEAYAKSIGLTDGEIAKIRGLLLK